MREIETTAILQAKAKEQPEANRNIGKPKSHALEAQQQQVATATPCAHVAQHSALMSPNTDTLEHDRYRFMSGRAK